MTEFVVFFIVGQLMACSLHALWFQTALPVYVFKMLRTIGWKKHDTAFWPEALDYKYWYRTHWQTWVEHHPSMPELLKTGMNCPGCMAFQCSFWTALFVSVFLVTGMKLCLFLAASIGWPFLVVLSYCHFRMQQTLQKNANPTSNQAPRRKTAPLRHRVRRGDQRNPE